MFCRPRQRVVSKVRQPSRKLPPRGSARRCDAAYGLRVGDGDRFTDGDDRRRSRRPASASRRCRNRSMSRSGDSASQ